MSGGFASGYPGRLLLALELVVDVLAGRILVAAGAIGRGLGLPRAFARLVGRLTLRDRRRRPGGSVIGGRLSLRRGLAGRAAGGGATAVADPRIASPPTRPSVAMKVGRYGPRCICRARRRYCSLADPTTASGSIAHRGRRSRSSASMSDRRGTEAYLPGRRAGQSRDSMGVVGTLGTAPSPMINGHVLDRHSVSAERHAVARGLRDIDRLVVG
jgi:hypothetical protein